MTIKNVKKIFCLGPTAALFLALGCNSYSATPQALLDRYFSSAVRQDYLTTYSCYYSPYRSKVSSEDFVKHRKEASVLTGYQVASLDVKGDQARADVILTFGPSEKFKRKEPVKVKVKEDLVREGNEWRIKVW